MISFLQMIFNIHFYNYLEFQVKCGYASKLEVLMDL